MNSQKTTIYFITAIATVGIIIALVTSCQKDNRVEVEECHFLIEKLCEKSYFCFRIKESDCVEYLNSKDMCKFESNSQYNRFVRCANQIGEMSCSDLRMSVHKANYSICSEFTEKGGL